MPRKKPKNKRMRRRLDDVVRVYTKLRDNDTCQICGIHKLSTPEGTIDWSHYISRNYLSVRWHQYNSIASCRCCHREYAQGFNSPMMESINKMWGPGTTKMLEKIARDYPAIKGTYLQDVDFRLQLEEYYKKLIDCINAGWGIKELTENYKYDIWHDENIHRRYIRCLNLK